jgi:hypothetical protein
LGLSGDTDNPKGLLFMQNTNWVGIAALLVGVLLGMTVLKSLGPSVLGIWLRARFWVRHGRKGRRVLFVYSDSSTWKEQIETKILPRLGDCSVVLNWSKRREWGSSMQLEARLFDQWAGSGEFTPTAILLPPLGKMRVFRLWQHSANPKQGKSTISKEALQSLFATLKEIGC